MTIEHVKEGWRIVSSSGRPVGTFASYSSAVNREKEILFWKQKKGYINA